jgi:uncharacterized protein YndB with AHSA1/START domain
VAEVDLRVGGRLRLVMRDTEGNEFGGEGTYVAVERPRRLSFTWRWDRPELGTQLQVVDVIFTANPDGTTAAVLTNSGLHGAEADSHREGWELSFVNLDALLVDGST